MPLTIPTEVREVMRVPPKSKAQARLFGAIAGGRSTKAKGMSRSQAREALRGSKLKGLPARVRKGRKR